MGFGYNNKVLRVDLGSACISIEQPGDKFYRKYCGGLTMGAYYILNEVPAHTDPLSPENVLVFAPGLLTGTRGPALPRYTVMARSPLTGTIGKSEAGGFFGPSLNQAGFDAIVLSGAAEKPVYLYIEEGEAKLLDAAHLWGKGTKDCQTLIRETHGEDVCVAQTGPAGENGVLFANIVNELAHFNGRNGLGAVMGSKMLKAIAVKKKGAQLQIKDEKASLRVAKNVAQRMKDHPLAWSLHVYGTPAGVEISNAAGFLPTRNWQQGTFDQADKIGAEAMESIHLSPRGCYCCPLRCKRVVKTEDEYAVDPAYGGPEFETLAALGSSLGIGDIKILAKANEMCNDLTMDTISFGMTVAFAMECYEKGYLTKKDTGGLELRFGSKDLLLTLVELTARREGIGGLLALGSAKLAEKLGDETLPMRMTVKGQEPPVHDPRWKGGIAMMFAISYNGADHWVAQHDHLYKDEDSTGLAALHTLGIADALPVGDLSWKKVRVFYYTHMLVAAFDALGACGLGYEPRSATAIKELMEMLEAATGWDTSLWEMMKVGERAINMQRLFNIREGFGSKDDTLPRRFFEPLSTPQGVAVVDEKELKDAVALYYEMAGWDEDGRPRRGKLYELGLDAFVGQ